MKLPALLICLMASFPAFAQSNIHKINNGNVPIELVTDDTTYWTVSTLSGVSYVNTTPGAYYGTYKSGGGMIVKFKFIPGGRFEFLMYLQANTYGIENESWTELEGTVTFTKDNKNQSVFITRAEKGTYRITKNGVTSSRAIPENELKAQHSNTYLWERTTFADDHANIYLLMVDLDEHPTTDINNPSTIDPSWVSKFHIPVK